MIAIKALTKRMTAVADRLEPFSGNIALARARNEAAQIRQNIRAAEKLGERLGRFEEARGGIGRALERVGDAIAGPILNILVPILEAGEVVADGVAVIAEGIGNVIEFGQTLVAPFSSMVKIGRKLLGYEEQKEKRELLAEANVIDDFVRLEDLTVEFNGRVYGADKSRVVEGERKFDGPLPRVPLP